MAQRVSNPMSLTETSRAVPSADSQDSLYGIVWHELQAAGVRFQQAEHAAASLQQSADAALTRLVVAIWALERQAAHGIGDRTPSREDPAFLLLELVFDLLQESQQAGLEALDFDGAVWSPDCRELAEVESAVPCPGTSQPTVLKTLQPAIRFQGRLIARAKVILSSPAPKLPETFASPEPQIEGRNP